MDPIDSHSTRSKAMIPKRKTARFLSCLIVGVLTGFAADALLGRIRSERVLGIAKLEQTAFSIRVSQERSVLNWLGLGHTKIYACLVNPEGEMIQCQEVPIFESKYNTQWATWQQPDPLPLQIEKGVQSVTITLLFTGGGREGTRVVLGPAL
jgi:hypothetical protein